MERRKFIKDVGSVLLSVQVIPLARVWGDYQGGQNQDQYLVIHSGESKYLPMPGHRHDLQIPMSDLKNPPSDGVHLYTTWAYLHRHHVELSQKELQIITGGDEITVRDTVGDHAFVIKLSEQNS